MISQLKNKDFVEEPISELLKFASIIEGETPPEVINPLSVSIISSGKKASYPRFKICKYPCLQRQNTVRRLEMF